MLTHDMITRNKYTIEFREAIYSESDEGGVMFNKLKYGIFLLAVGFSASIWATGTEYVQMRDTLKLAAEKGDPEAQYLLGRSYCCGHDPVHNVTTALRWFCRAAKQDHVEAQFMLGREISSQTTAWRAVVENPLLVDAYVWYSVAASRGHQLAAQYAQSLALDLSQDQLQSAKKRMANWQNLSCDP